MIVALAADHAGFELKQKLLDFLRAQGHEILDLGTHDTQPVDYPDFAVAIGQALQRGEAERGILVCGSGVGASVAVNKLKGIRGGLAHDTYSAHQSVEHDDVNVLCLGSRVIGEALARELAQAFLMASFSEEPRHKRRLEKIEHLESRWPRL